jgi:hypothetical protein
LGELPPNLYKLEEKFDEIPAPAKTHLSHVAITIPHDRVLNILNKVKDHNPWILFDKPMGKNILKAEKIKTLSLEYNITI